MVDLVDDMESRKLFLFILKQIENDSNMCACVRYK